MPKYSLDDVQFLVRERAYAFVTSKSRSHIQSLGLTEEQAAAVLLLLDERTDFRKVFPHPCVHELGVSICDDYLLWVDLDSHARCAPGVGTKLYIKVAIDSHPADGDCCLVISFHVALR